jgi:hypothetical protein
LAIQKYGSKPRLFNNQLYTVTFTLDGEEKTFSFTSRYSPLYSTVKVLRNDYPSLFADISDNTLHFQIWLASQMGEELGNEEEYADGKPSFAMKQYVRYKSEYEIVKNILIANSMHAGATEKRLGEFSINSEVKTPEIEAILKALKDELKKWEGAIGNVLQNRGAIRANDQYPYPLNPRVGF